MKESVVTKFQTVVEWFLKNNPEETRTLVTAGDVSSHLAIEQLVGKKLPEEFVALYSSFNGEEGPGMGIFLAHSFLSCAEIIQALEISKTFVKPKHRSVDNPADAERLIKAIISEYQKSLPNATAWYKFEFMCAPNSLQLPYFFPDRNTTDRQKEMFDLDEEAQQKVGLLVRELHDLEKSGYNWDELHVTAWDNGEFNVRRADFEFIADIPFTSFPEGAIRKTYFNPNWVPVIFDNLGNYIGIDLDPDVHGVSGQVIVFGRDEEDMFVVANTFEQFLDFNLDLIDKNPSAFLEGKHIHDIYKKIVLG